MVKKEKGKQVTKMRKGNQNPRGKNFSVGQEGGDL